MAFSMSQLKPVGTLSQRFGWKGCVYGGPGTGKTPFMMTAPYPVHAFIETGLASVSDVMDQPGVVLSTAAQIEDYVQWCIGSHEAKQFQTKTFDSFSQIAQMKLDEVKKAEPKAHGKQHYGAMGEWMMTKVVGPLYLMPESHMLGICKQTTGEVEGEGERYKPAFPGKMLDSEIPHLFDSFWRLEILEVRDAKGVSTPQQVIRTKGDFKCFARERTKKLAELEHANLTYLINKAMA